MRRNTLSFEVSWDEILICCEAYSQTPRHGSLRSIFCCLSLMQKVASRSCSTVNVSMRTSCITSSA
jgi:hypothetical protein